MQIEKRISYKVKRFEMEEQNKATVPGNQKRRREEDETTAESSRNTYRKKRYSCSKCDLKTDGLEYFRNHVANHGSKQKFTCPHCDFSNHRIQGVVIHLKMRHTSQATSSSEVLFMFYICPITMVLKGISNRVRRMWSSTWPVLQLKTFGWCQQLQSINPQWV